jgi:hypothetical protein
VVYSILRKESLWPTPSVTREKVLIRVRRIRGQVDAIQRALESEEECTGALQLMAACRGALSGLMAEVMRGISGFTYSPPIKLRIPRKRKPQSS